MPTVTNPSFSSSHSHSHHSSSNTALHVWWFGGSEKIESTLNDDSCELVAVHIERTSSNSRRIAGEISVPCGLEDVWAILTDYDHLAVHVPNLMESRIVHDHPSSSGSNIHNNHGSPGDGSYQCRLFQRGAQKIVGFEFGASLTMDMTERIVVPPNMHDMPQSQEHAFYPQERKIEFKCVESPFFSEFDGAWTVKESSGHEETVVSYVVDVRPRGPVPVAALEWRIREDVPTNLRAVKRAALHVGEEGVTQRKKLRQVAPSSSSSLRAAAAAVQGRTAKLTPPTKLKNAVRGVVPVSSSSSQGDWFEDETMAAYLKDSS